MVNTVVFTIDKTAKMCSAAPFFYYIYMVVARYEINPNLNRHCLQYAA